MDPSAPSVLMVANWDWVLYNFRLALAKSLRREGYRVTFVCPDGEYVEELRKEGFSWIEWSLKRRSLNPLMEVRALWSLARIYQRVQPDLLHHDTIKPNVYGALATWLNEKRGVTDSPPEVINSFMGIGFLFSNRPLARYLRPLVLPLMRFGMRQTHIYTTFSNHEDRETFIQRRLVRPDQTRVIVSEFVNTDYFHPPGETSVQEKQPVRVLMAARLLWDKGVQEFVEAAQLFDQRGVPVEFLLAGEPDTSTPGFVPEERLREWHEAGTIRWLGHRSDMPNLLRSVDIAALPTHYNEGLPRFLVEAASSGLPLIASDIEACRRVLEEDENGHIVPRKDAESLANAIQHLALNPEKRQKMGQVSRRRAVAEFAECKVVKEWVDLYSQRLTDATPSR